MTEHWLYFYECSVGCIGILKDWLLRAVSTALDDGHTRLSLDCVQDHALPVDIYRQMALDAYEGEQRLNHTEANREHVWQLLQGGELIAPVPPLPPRETEPSATGSSGSATCEPEVNNGSLPESNSAPLPETEKPVVKKTKSRKKVEAKLPEQEVSRVILASDPTPEVAPKPAHGRRKKTAEPAQDAPFAEGASNGSGPSTPTDSEMVAASAKPKRTRRVGEPKPKRYPVGEQEAEQGV